MGVPQRHGERLIEPLQALADAQPPGSSIHKCTSHWAVWNGSEHSGHGPFPWEEVHPDREIGTELLGTLDRYIPLRTLQSPGGTQEVAATLVRAIQLLPPSTPGSVFDSFGSTTDAVLMFEKGQAGVAPDIAAKHKATAQNPVVLDAVGAVLFQYNVPSLPQIEWNSTLLRFLWPRLQQYAVPDHRDPLWKL